MNAGQFWNRRQFFRGLIKRGKIIVYALENLLQNTALILCPPDHQT